MPKTSATKRAMRFAPAPSRDLHLLFPHHATMKSCLNPFSSSLRFGVNFLATQNPGLRDQRIQKLTTFAKYVPSLLKPDIFFRPPPQKKKTGWSVFPKFRRFSKLPGISPPIFRGTVWLFVSAGETNVANP